MKRFVVVVSCLFAASAGLAQPPSESAATETAPSAQSTESPAGGTTSRDEETLCRRIAADTGSRIAGRQRVCMTRRQWREHDRRN
jgi:hypothetical protein